MEPLGASHLNEELEDDRQVSTDIIVTVCDFLPMKQSMTHLIFLDLIVNCAVVCRHDFHLPSN